ncbi:hypothetical protein [Duganella qianjiadongensis]|uniref:Uncharacterized protein n=1 Tax=Duganella qianjiadongensis TaxID=2692176 RepID=A0ABW9VNU9_9BURK|nr:hypothetical protein [Duganella qianjiadongensis]MYM40300.1 hypothetical protein [Duganella qianjiadongensis]
MILALISTEPAAAAELGQQLALLRTTEGKRVLLQDSAGTAGRPAHPPYDDTVIYASAAHDSNHAAALAMASLIVVLLQPDDLQQQHTTAQLLNLLRGAASHNPAARILVSVAHGARELSVQEVGNILLFVAQLESARLVEQLVLDERGAYYTRHSALAHADEEDDQVLCTPEVRHLYRQVFAPGANA